MNADEKHAARMLLGHYGHAEGLQGGSFTTALLNAWEKADENNKARLGQAFPEYVYPIGVARSRGIEALADILRT